MAQEIPSRGFSLQARLILTYLVILGIGGLATSIVGSWIVSSTIREQVLRSRDNNLATARMLYDLQLEDLRRTVRLAASGTTIEHYLARGDRKSLLAYLGSIRQDAGCDFLAVADAGDAGALYQVAVIRAGLSGTVAAGTEILSADQLERENQQLRDRARTTLSDTASMKPFDRREDTSGMVLMAAAPVRTGGAFAAVLYGGILLNGNLSIVDRVANLVLRDHRGGEIGNVTIFQHNFRISTSVRTAEGNRAVGTRVASQVEEHVLRGGESWQGRAFVANQWHLSRYDPIRDYQGNIVGVLSAGLLEETYTSTRNQVILSFAGVAGVGFLCIIGITYYMIRSITRPLGEMVSATRNIAAGRFDHEVRCDSQYEIGQLAASFNAMLKSLRQMRADLEEWGRTLEEKVRQRTEELGAMQARVAQSERLASLGLLAAGIAHEINNPLGGILALTALTLEDVKPDDPNRENLEEVLKQSERCRNIVKGLLDFSRQSKGNIEPVDLNKIVQDTLSLITNQSLFFNIKIVKDLDPHLPPVTGDRSQLVQVIMNIMINAVQAMDEKGTITIVTLSNAARDSVEVAISDTGLGIGPEQIDRIFDPFFTTKEGGRGTGLGLSIAYGIVTTHRGAISVESEPGKGSTFTIRFPVAAAIPKEMWLIRSGELL